MFYGRTQFHRMKSLLFKIFVDTPATVQKKKDSMTVEFSLGIQNEAMTDGSM